MTKTKPVPSKPNDVGYAQGNASTKLMNTLGLAARLARNSLWGIKLYSILTILIIAAPLSICWAFAMKPMMEQRTARSAQVLGYDKYESRAQRWSIPVHDFARVDQDVKAIAGKDTVSIITSPLNDVRDSWACSGDCLKWILWGPAEGTLAKTSQLVSGRWPTNSREVLVSDTAVADGAQDSGTIKLNVDGRESQTFTIVGVGRTVLGQRNTVYTSILDEAITKADGLPTDRQRNMWLFPGNSLSNSQEKQLKELGLTVGRRADVAKAGFLRPDVGLAAVLTAFAALVCSQVFSIGLSRLRQSLNTIMQNGGNRRVTLSCCLMQGTIVGALAAALSSVVALAAAAYIKSTPTPAFHPLGNDLREIPVMLIAAMGGLTFLVTLLASLIPALTLRPGNVVEQAKTFSGREADLTLTKTRLTSWEIALTGSFFSAVVIASALTGVESDGLGSHFTAIVGQTMPASLRIFVLPTLVVWSLAALFPLFRTAIDAAREWLYRKSHIGPGTRQSLAYNTPLMSVASWLVLIVVFTGAFESFSRVTRSNPSGTHVAYVSPDLPQSLPTVIDKLAADPALKGIELFPQYTLDRSLPGSGQKTGASLYVGTCPVAVGKTHGDLSAPCGDAIQMGEMAFGVPDAALTKLYNVDANTLARMRRGAALLFPPADTPHWSSAEMTQNARLVKFDAAQSADADKTQVTELTQAHVLPAMPRAPWQEEMQAHYVFSEAWLREQGYPLAPSRVLIRSRSPLHKSQQYKVEDAVTTGRRVDYVDGPDNPVDLPRILIVLAAGLGLLLALSSHKLTNSLRALGDLGATFPRRLLPVVQHCCFAGSAAAGLGLVGGLLLAGIAYVPLHLVVKPYAFGVEWNTMVYLSYVVVIPLAAVAMAVPCTVLWTFAAKRLGPNDVHNPMRPVLIVAGLVGLGIAVLLMRGGL